MSGSSSSASVLASSDTAMRCIAHLDMDCFYAQVEAVRLGIDCRTVPLVLSQWDCLIAVNYPARAYGIKRGQHSASEAKKLCPDLVIAFSPSYRMGESISQYHPNPSRNSYKISLEPYRLASRKIFAILASEPGVQVEKGSIDEAYVDVTAAAHTELAQLRAAAAGRHLDALADVLAPSTRLIGDRRSEMQAWFSERGTSLAAVFDAPMRALLRGECGAAVGGSRGFCVDAADARYGERCLLLCAASRVVQRLRDRLYAELRYDCSAGIAHNRVLAKCISATHKPNQQTLLLPDRSASALFDLPLAELRGFGGKFGAAVSAVCGGATECRELWLAPLSQLYALNSTAFTAGDDEDDEGENDGENENTASGSGSSTRNRKRKTEGDAEPVSIAEYTFYRIRGVHSDIVTDPALPRSMEASKIFHPCCGSWSAARLWMAPLAGELWYRFQHYEDRYYREGRSLVVYFRTYVSPEDVRHGCRSQSFRRHTPLPGEVNGAAMLANMGLRELEKLMREVTNVDIKPCNIDFKTRKAASAQTATEAAPTLASMSTSTTAVVAGILSGSGDQATEKEGTVETIDGVSVKENSAVPMPPLRVLGLSIIGLRPRLTVESADGHVSVAPDLAQRSLKDMFASLSAAAARGPSSARNGLSAKSSVPHEGSRVQSAAGSAGAIGSATAAPLPVVEIGSDEECGSVHAGSQRQRNSGKFEGIGDTGKSTRTRLNDNVSRKGTNARQSSPSPPPTLPPQPRRTLEEFFHYTSPLSPSVGPKEKSKPTQVLMVGEENEEAEERIRGSVTETEGAFHHRLSSSTSVIEVSSDEDEETIE